MQIELKVTHTLSPEVLNFLTQFSKGFAAPVPLEKEIKEEEKKPEVKITKVASTGSNESDDQPTLVQVRAAAAEISKQDGKREKVSALVKTYGINSLPKLDPKDFKDFLQKLKAL